MKKKVVIVIALALSVILALTLLAGCAKTTDSAFSQGMIAVQKDGLWGFADENGDIAIECKYDSVSPFYGEYAAVQMGSRSFLIDVKGNDTGIELASVSVDASVSVAANEDRTLLAAREKYTGLAGVLSTESGEWVIRAAYDMIDFLEGGLVLVTIGSGSGNYGLFDATGAEICPVEYTDCAIGENAVIMEKTVQGERVADVFATDGTVISEDVKIADAGTTKGGLAYYEYTTPATDTAAEKVNQVVPGMNWDKDTSVSELIEGTTSVYVTEDTATSAEGVTTTYSVFKADGTALFNGLTKAPVYYKDTGVLQIDRTAADATAPSYTYVDMKSGSALENVPNDFTVNGETPAISFMRLDDDSLYYAIGKEVFAMGNSTAVFTGAEDEEEVGVLAANVFVGATETGVTRIYNGTARVFETGAGEAFSGSGMSVDGAYFAVTNAEGYVALYKNDGTRLFGFDKEITDVSFAE